MQCLSSVALASFSRLLFSVLPAVVSSAVVPVRYSHGHRDLVPARRGLLDIARRRCRGVRSQRVDRVAPVWRVDRLGPAGFWVLNNIT